MKDITLNKADIVEILKTLETYKVDHFRLIRHSESGIGYCMDIEYQTNLNDRMVTIKVPIVGTENW